VWSERSEEAGGSGTDSKVFLVWKEGTQKVGVSKRKREKKKRRDAITRGMEEGEGA